MRVLVAGTSLGVQRRLGQTEHLERSESRDLGLRVFVGKRQALVSSTAVDPAGFALLAERAVAMARVVPEDPYAGLAERAAPPDDAAALDLDDPAEPDAEALIARAAAAEEAALAVPGVTNSEGGRGRLWPHRAGAGDLGRVRRAVRPHQPFGVGVASWPAAAPACSATTTMPPPCIWPTWTTRRGSAAPPASGRWRG